jgi:acyl dehydratase
MPNLLVGRSRESPESSRQGLGKGWVEMPNGRAVAEALQVGETVGEVVLTITEEMVDAYAEAVGDFNPLFMENDITGRRIAHPELLPKIATDILWVPMFERMPNIRAKQAYTYLEPVRTGLTYRASGSVVEKYEKRGKLFLVFEAIFRDEGGKEVLRDRRTQLVLSEDVTIKR